MAFLGQVKIFRSVGPTKIKGYPAFAPAPGTLYAGGGPTKIKGLPVVSHIQGDPISVLPTMRDGQPIRTASPWYRGAGPTKVKGYSANLVAPRTVPKGLEEKYATTPTYTTGRWIPPEDRPVQPKRTVPSFSFKDLWQMKEKGYGQYISKIAKAKRGAFEETPMSRADYYGEDEVREVTPRTAGRSFGLRQLTPFDVPVGRNAAIAADAAPIGRPMMPEIAKRFGLLMANEVPTEVDEVETVQRRRMRPRVSPARMPGGIAEFLQNLFSGKLFGRGPLPTVEEVSPWVDELGPVPVLSPFGS